jgi:hypothetical protein
MDPPIRLSINQPVYNLVYFYTGLDATGQPEQAAGKLVALKGLGFSRTANVTK